VCSWRATLSGLFASIGGLGQYVHVGLTSGAVKKYLPVNVVQNILFFPFVLQEQLRKGKRNVEMQISWKEWWSESGYYGCWYGGRKLVCKVEILLKGSSQCGGYHTLLFPQLVESFLKIY
jgi:hypothetical protein